MKLSYSQLACWNSCKKKWAYNYKERLVPRVDRPRLDLGSAVHAGIAFQLRNPNDPMGAAMGVSEFVHEKLEKKLTEAEEEALMDIGDRATKLAEALYANILEKKYSTYYHQSEPMVECKLESPLPIVGWEGFKGYIDWVAVEEATGHVWLVDFKVRSSFQAQEAEEYSVQMAIYMALMRERGIDVRGSISWQVRDTPPKDPKMTTKGTMSKAKIATTWQHYRDCLIREGLDPADYEEEMKPKCDEIEWFRLSRAYRADAEIRNIWNEVVLPTATSIMRPQHHTRNLVFMSCRGCSYNELCLEELRGGDVEFIKKTRFRSLDEQQIDDPELVPAVEEWVPPEITE